MLKQSYVYILTNLRKTVLYIGVTSNLKKRISDHESGCGSAFTRKYKVKQLVYFEVFEDISFAIQREKSLKGITRKKKEALISSVNPTWQDLGLTLFKIAEILRLRLRMTGYNLMAKSNIVFRKLLRTWASVLNNTPFGPQPPLWKKCLFPAFTHSH